MIAYQCILQTTGELGQTDDQPKKHSSSFCALLDSNESKTPGQHFCFHVKIQKSMQTM